MADLKSFLESTGDFIKQKVQSIDVDGMLEDVKKAGASVGDQATKAYGSVKTSLESIDTSGVEKTLSDVGGFISNTADDVKTAAVKLKEDVENKLTELDRALEASITEYNDAYTMMNDRGYSLYLERVRSADAIDNITALVNSIANRPSSFDKEFEEINSDKAEFEDACSFGKRELDNARKSAVTLGAGVAAGAAVASMAPTAAMWVAMTFGTASTGTAISALSGAAATNAALAWLGGGALAAGGGGVAAGNALLALAGPIGWGIAGATLLTSIVLFSKNKMKLAAEKSKQIESIRANTEAIKELDVDISAILDETVHLREGLAKKFMAALPLYNSDYRALSEQTTHALGDLVRDTRSLSTLFRKTVTQKTVPNVLDAGVEEKGEVVDVSESE